MALTAKQKLSGTLPASRGMRYLAPGGLPARPTGYKDLDRLLNEYLALVEHMRRDSATLARLTQVIEQADEEHAQRVYEARVRREKEPTDPRPDAKKRLEATQAALDVSEYTVVQTSERLQDLRDDPDLHEYAQEVWNEKLSRVADLADTLADAMDDLGEAQYLRTWLMGHKATKVVQGRNELAAFRRKIAEYEDTEPTRRISPAAMQALRRGEDVEDIEGNPLTFAVADDLFRRGKLAVNHGKLLPRNAPEQA
jgi:hypothetical protein